MWDFSLRLDRSHDRSLFMQVAQAIIEDISRGRLRPGDRLPGSRTLAATIAVNRVTVLAAYDELAAEGWIATHAARGTFVSADLPHDAPARPRPRAVTGGSAFTLPPGPSLTKWLPPARGALAFRSSYPDTRLIRTEPLLRAYRRVLRRSGGMLFGYGDPEGHPRLRRAIAGMLRDTRALAVSAENILVTRGSQMALALAGRALLRPGDAIAVEDPGYRFAWDAFRQSGATLVPVPVNGGGLDVTALARIAERSPIRAVYLTPHHQLPTTVTMAMERREALLNLARTHRFVVIEDDYDHEFHFAGRPAVPLASLDPGLVLYVGTFSKTLAPGLRIGYLAAPAAIVEQVSAYRQALDLQGDPAMEAALAELIEDGEVQRHVRRVKRLYRMRRDLLCSLLERHLPDALECAVPAGGIGLWAHAAQDVDVERWAASSLRRGVAFLTARSFTFDGRSRPFLRLGYACLDEPELRMAVERMGAALMARARAGHPLSESGHVQRARSGRSGAMRYRAAGSMLLLCACLLPSAAAAQFSNGNQTILLNLPRASPHAVVTQRVGVTDITIDYHRPRAKGRRIFGDVVWFDRVWRAGANDNTTIEFPHPVSVEGQPLPAGRYGLFMIPGKDEWTVIFSKNSTSWGNFTYDAAEDALRVKVKPRTSAFREELTYEFGELTADTATVVLVWETVAVPFRLKVDTKTLTLESLRRELRHLPGYKAEAWYEAALYCVDHRFNYDEALKWIDRAIAEGEENFDNLDLKAQILGGLGRTQDVGTVQAKALALATPEQMYAYGDRLLREKKIADAEGVFASVTQKHPGSWLPWYGLARVQVAKGDRTAAERSLQAALKAATASGAKQGIAGMKRMLERLAAGQGIG